MEWLAKYIAESGVVGVLALALLATNAGSLMAAWKYKKNGHQKYGRRADDGLDENGSRITMKDLRTAIHTLGNETNRAMNTLSGEMLALTREVRIEIVNMKDRLAHLESREHAKK